MRPKPESTGDTHVFPLDPRATDPARPPWRPAREPPWRPGGGPRQPCAMEQARSPPPCRRRTHLRAFFALRACELASGATDVKPAVQALTVRRTLGRTVGRTESQGPFGTRKRTFGTAGTARHNPTPPLAESMPKYEVFFPTCMATHII